MFIHPIIVYKATCKLTNKCYVGNTETHIEDIMVIYNQAKDKIERILKSDFFTNYMGEVLKGMEHCTVKTMGCEIPPYFGNTV